MRYLLYIFVMTQGGADAGTQGGQQYYDADYKVVDDDDQNKK